MAFPLTLLLAAVLPAACNPSGGDAASVAGGPAVRSVPQPDFTLTADQTHNRWSAAIPPAVRVPSGAVIEAFTKEASDGQLSPASTPDDLSKLSFDPIHPLTGPVYVEDARPGDVLAVTLHVIEPGDWGWAAVIPGFGQLAGDGEFSKALWYRTFELGPGATTARFAPGIEIPIRPFAGVMGVAPATDEMLSTIPPRANGGNMDNRHLVAGTTVYFPVFVEGALFSIGDTHAAQGDGEVSGTGIESPMRIVYAVRVIKGGRPIREPEYETADDYAVTAHATTLDEAARQATRYMVDYLEQAHGLDRTDAYVLASLAADLRIAAVVDVPHVLVAMHIPKHVLPRGR
ncbi:MAG TPA: acetamidase/formamidase family protein [Vicinamibacterales bacterium]|nr:acetamidase/formamidase family protein [Vicinamibacterales bacterium]